MQALIERLYIRNIGIFLWCSDIYIYSILWDIIYCRLEKLWRLTQPYLLWPMQLNYGHCLTISALRTVAMAARRQGCGPSASSTHHHLQHPHMNHLCCTENFNSRSSSSSPVELQQLASSPSCSHRPPVSWRASASTHIQRDFKVYETRKDYYLLRI